MNDSRPSKLRALLTMLGPGTPAYLALLFIPVHTLMLQLAGGYGTLSKHFTGFDLLWFFLMLVAVIHGLKESISLIYAGHLNRSILVKLLILAMFNLISIIYLFALVFALLSDLNSAAFNVPELDLFTAIYFSITVIATVGFGDIYPVSAGARAVVSLEIFTGLLYGVFVFSLVAGVVRDTVQNDQTDTVDRTSTD